MRIRHVSIRNFRGIRELDWAVPDTRIICLIGRGDSTKSTILETCAGFFIRNGISRLTTPISTFAVRQTQS